MSDSTYTEAAGIPMDLLNALREAILVTSHEGLIRYANPAAERLFQAATYSLNRRALPNLVSGAPSASDLSSRLERMSRAEGWIPQRQPVEIRCEDGSKRPVLVDIGIYPHPREALRFVVLCEPRLADSAPRPRTDRIPARGDRSADAPGE